jgi:hypothetical protein
VREQHARPILCLDFDGVVHSYKSGWQGADVIPDDVTPGFFEWLDEAAQFFRIIVHSSRSKETGAIEAMQLWFYHQRKKWRAAGGVSPIKDSRPVEVEFVENKPAAFISIDDRALTFDGNWQHYRPADLLNFRPWNKQPAADAPHKCAEQTSWHLNLQHFGNTNMKYLEVTGACRACGRKAQFRGPMGVSSAHPTVAVDGSEAVFPFLFDGETYDGKALGYTVTSPEAN